MTGRGRPAAWLGRATLCGALVLLGCDDDPQPEAAAPAPSTSMPEGQQSAPPSARRWKITRSRGVSEPTLQPGANIPEGPLRLAAGALWIVDDGGARYAIHGPALAAFVEEPRPALLVERGVFTLQRSGSARRDEVGTVATAAVVVGATGPAQLVGVARGRTTLVVTLAGGVHVWSPAAGRAEAGTRVRFGPEGTQRGAAPPGNLETRVARWLAEPPLPEADSAPHADRAAGLFGPLRRELHAFESLASPRRRPQEPALAYRRRLAEAAARRMELRQGLENGLLRLMAATLSGSSPGAATLAARVRAVLSRGRR